jgi:hypothetical protein
MPYPIAVAGELRCEGPAVAAAANVFPSDLRQDGPCHPGILRTDKSNLCFQRWDLGL